MQNKKYHVVMSGPTPPAIGGMASVLFDMNNSSLASRVNLQLFDTKKATQENRSIVTAIIHRFKLWYGWLRIIKRSNHTIAHIHTCSGLSFFLDSLLMLLAKAKGVKGVLHIHGAKFDEFLDDLTPIKKKLAFWFLRIADAVVVLSEEWRNTLEARVSGAKYIVIANGVPIPKVSSAIIASSSIRVLFLGNLCQRKGVWDLLTVAEKLPSGIKIFLVGGEEDIGIGKKIKTHIADNQLTEKIEWMGTSVGKEKLRWFIDTDIFILPSYAEGLPISLLEAMAYAMPVITTPVGGIPSVIQHMKNGVLVQPGDAEEIMEAILLLSNDLDLRQHLGAAGRETCVNFYGVEKAASCYIELYERLYRKDYCL